jgi:hypothetical protein
MSYIGINPYNNLDPFLETRPMSSYPIPVLNEVKLLSFNKKDEASPFGSFIYRLQKYPGDIDLVETFTECCTMDEVINKFSRALKKMIKDISNKRTHYFSEVKAGLDKRYDIDIGNMINGRYLPDKKLFDYSMKMYYNNLITEDEFKIIFYIFKNVKDLGQDEYDTIYNIFREHRILRWQPKEILEGKKILPGNQIKYLNDALQDHTPVKIDQLVLLGDRFIEVTNFVMLAIQKDDELVPINIDLELEHNANVQLPQEIEKLYFSDYYYSPFKMIKRMYSLARHNRNEEILYKIIPFVSSNISLLYQLKSEIDTLILILKKLKTPPTITINKQLDGMKNRLASIIEIGTEDLENYNQFINKIIKTKKSEEKIEMLERLNKSFKKKINYDTIKYLEKIEFNPPPYYVLPITRKYSTFTRSRDDNPENPLKMYTQLVQNL